MNRYRAWGRSLAVKSFVIAFVATHLPLLALLALVVLRPGSLSPMGVLAAALGATVVAAVLLIGSLWFLFRPLRRAADGLRDFMLNGRPLRIDAASADEVGRLVKVLVLALSHVERGRAAQLHSSALALERVAGKAPGAGDPQYLALVEIDQWPSLDAGTSLERMQEVQAGMNRAIAHALHANEFMLPWGRGRFLLVLKGKGADVHERLQPLCDGFRVASVGSFFTCSAAVEPRTGLPGAWPAALQRLDYRLFSIRLEGREAVVV